MAVHSILKTKLSDPTRLYRNTVVKLGELLAVSGLDLAPARTAVSTTIGGVLPVHFGQAIERQVTASFDYLRRLRARVDQTGPDALRNMVYRWDQHLVTAAASAAASANDPPDTKSVLVGFSVIEDQNLTLTQTELDRLIQEVARWGGLSDAEVRHKASTRADSGVNGKGDPLDDAVWDGIDVLAHILLLMRRQGLKPAVTNPELQQHLIDFFTASSAVEKTFGGAAGNESFILTAMDCPVLLHMPYHHPAQAAIAPNGANRLSFASGGAIRPFPSIGLGHPDDARRFSFVMQLTPQTGAQGAMGPVFSVGNQNHAPSRPDRIIFRIQNPRTNTAPGWKKLQIRWQGPSAWTKAPPGAQYNKRQGYWFVEIDRSALPGFLANDWPYLFVFQYPPVVEKHVLVVELASAAAMKSVGEQVKATLLGGIQALTGTVYTTDFTQFLREVLVEQLQALSSQSVSLHLELSGVAAGPRLMVLKDILARAGLRNLSLNREELAQITSEFRSPFFTAPRSAGLDTPVEIYWRAAELLKRLDIDTLYVHDIELDLLVRRERTDEDETSAGKALERHRQAMLLAKAALPAVLFERASAEHSWELLFSTESLAALLAFAKDYATMFPPARRDAVEQDLLTKGYRYPGVDNVSVVVSPTLYVDFPSAVSLSGAGDMCFAVHGAMAG